MTASAWALPPDAFEFLGSRLSPESTIVELGSGEGTRRLVDCYARVFSVEHDEKYVGKYDSNYIHAPIVGHWYDPDAIRGKLPAKYDCIIVDGPPGAIGRLAMLEHLDLFQPVPLLVDDVNRSAERELAIGLAQSRDLPLSVHYLTSGRAFATIGWSL